MFQYVSLVAVSFVVLVYAGFLPAMFAAMLSYGCVRMMSTKLVALGNHSERSNIIAVSVIAVVVVGMLIGIGLALNKVVHDDSGIIALGQEMGHVLEASSQIAPAWLAENIPEKDEFIHHLADWFKEHSQAIGAMGVKTLKTVGYILVGLIIGAMIAVQTTLSDSQSGPRTTALLQQLARINEAFWNVIGAQIKISALNTTLTAIYLLVIMPVVFGTIPLAKTLVLVTFLAGLLPVVGNIISNTAIFIMSFTLGWHAALMSLTFLIVIHKMEYFINARFVGEKIKAKPSEILIVLIIGEHFFGIAGVISGPIFYAWIKQEWIRYDR
ncbi:MAG: AI-2E family transporter [Hahellaceae bacterium]|nr:AI-2E family transporter [Hahellaceae bacterium]